VALRKGDLKLYRRDPEARWMLLLILGSCVVIGAFLDIKAIYPNFFVAMRFGALTSSRWPPIAVS